MKRFGLELGGKSPVLLFDDADLHRWGDGNDYTARVLRAEFPYLRNRAKVLWSPSYFAASVGYVSESTVRRYIEHQWDAVAS